MRHKQLLTAEKCTLMVVDIQEAFTGHIPELDRIIERSRIMIEAAKLLGLPIVVSEQYPKGLGRTVVPLREVLGDLTYYDKLTFSCCQDKTIRQVLTDSSRSQLLLVGIEAHVCIAQTAFDALALGLEPYLAADAVGSRRAQDAETALQRMRQAGVRVTTTEAAIMEMTVSSKHPEFRSISNLIK